MLSGIRDNLGRGSVGDFLREKLQPGSAVSIVSAYFTIYAYDALHADLDAVGTLRFLFGEPRFVRSVDPDKPPKRTYQIEENGLKLAADVGGSEAEIDRLVYALYRLTEEEIAVVEGR